jgi:hypothetical protein
MWSASSGNDSAEAIKQVWTDERRARADRRERERERESESKGGFTFSHSGRCGCDGACVFNPTRSRNLLKMCGHCSRGRRGLS